MIDCILNNKIYIVQIKQKAILTFEEQLLEKAQKDIEFTEKLCTTQSNGMFGSLKKALKLSSSNNLNQQVFFYYYLFGK